MSSAKKICERNELWALIKKVSNFYGGDDAEELKASAKEMVEKYTIIKSLACFRDVASRLVASRVHCGGVAVPIPPQHVLPAMKIEPKKIRYQPPFNTENDNV